MYVCKRTILGYVAYNAKWSLAFNVRPFTIPFPFGSFLVLDVSFSLFYPTHTLSYALRGFTKSSIYSLNFCSYRYIMMLYGSFPPNNFSTFSRNVVNRQKRLPKCELKEQKMERKKKDRKKKIRADRVLCVSFVYAILLFLFPPFISCRHHQTYFAST